MRRSIAGSLLRPGRAAVRTGQGRRRPSGAEARRGYRRLGDFDQAQGHRHRPVLRRRFFRRRRDRGHRSCAMPRAASTSASWSRTTGIVGAVLYGDTVDGSWYFELLREGEDISDIRDELLFGQASPRRVRPRRTPRRRCRASRRCRDLRLQRRLQGHDRQGHHREGPVHARRRCARTPRRRPSAAPAPAWSSSCWRSTLGERLFDQRRPKSRCARAPSIRTTTVRRTILRKAAEDRFRR